MVVRAVRQRYGWAGAAAKVVDVPIVIGSGPLVEMNVIDSSVGGGSVSAHPVPMPEIHGRSGGVIVDVKRVSMIPVYKLNLVLVPAAHASLPFG
jgi:hypothetical protein